MKLGISTKNNILRVFLNEGTKDAYKLQTQMTQFFKFSLVLALFALIIPACTVEVIDDEEMETSGISDQVAQGFTGEGEEFITESAFAVQTTFFDDAGYLFHLFREANTCDDVTSNFSGDIRFFVESATPLEVKAYSGGGPYIGNSSFFGCDVEILEITETMIVGKVRGGNFEGDMNIEGRFTAEICM